MTDSVNVFAPGYRHPDPGGTWEFYEAGTATERVVYGNSDLTSELGAVIYSDADGYPVTAFGGSTRTLIYVGVGNYKIVVKDSGGVTLVTHDNIPGAVVGSGGGGEEAETITQAEADARYTRNANALSALTVLDDADLIPFWDTSASSNKAIRVDKLSDDIGGYLSNAGAIFRSGDTAVFYMTAAPVGWTIVTTSALNNAAIRLVTDAGGSTGGTANFTTVFASRTITKANLPSYTLDDTLSLSNNTGVTRNFSQVASGTPYSSPATLKDYNWTSSTISLTGSVTSGGSGDALDFAVKYANCLICQKD